MQTKTPGALREDHSLAPIQLEAASFKHDLAAFKRGERKPVTLALLGSLLATLALLLWLNSNDERSAYASTAKHLESLYAQQDAPFAGCVVLQPQASQQVLRSAIEAASQSSRKAYAEQLATCSRALVILERRLAAMDVPMSMEQSLDDLGLATSALNRAIGSYRSYLFDPNRAYEPTTAATHIDNIAVAWSNYQVQRNNTLNALRMAGQTR